ncbi:MAG TPA: hypothetical protein VF771_05425 [Longimicrobiaceae bacterium]
MPVLMEARPVHARWSEVNREFLDYVETNPACLDRASFASLYQDPSLRKFSIQPWPFFIDAAKRQEMEKVAVGMDRLVKGAVERFVRNDPKAVAHFYRTRGNVDGSPLAALRLSEPMLQLMIEEPNGIAGAPSRADYIETAQGLRMVEYNAGGALGGFQADPIAALAVAAAPTARFLSERNRHVRVPEILADYFRHVVDDTVRQGVWRDGEFNVAMVVRPHEPARVATHSAEVYTRHLRRALAERGMPAGHVFLCGPEDIVQQRGALTLHGHRLHAVVEQHDGSADMRAAFRAFKIGRVNLFSGPIAWLLTDKRNLVLLSQNAGSSDFTAEERELIERHLPWTRSVLPGATTFRGRPLRIPEDLVERREEFVVKKASSIGGRFVEVGRYQTPDEWSQAVARALWEEDWVVQEYQESVPYCFQSESGAARHEMVWGLFTFGSRFGGAFLRLAPAGNNAGRINGSQGAEVGAILEVLD